MISDNIQSVRQRIAGCCEKSGRRPEEVRLICVTKTASVGQIEEALAAGVAALGENRIQDAVAKHAVIGDRAQWHLIGHLQTNKARDAVKIFSLIHSVDTIRLAKKIDKEAAKLGKIQDILIQVNPVRNIISNGVNTSGEASKFGIEPGKAEGFIKEVTLYPNINIKGLMTIAPEVDDLEKVRPYFRALRELKDRLSLVKIGTVPTLVKPLPGGQSPFLPILSMGMTDDFEVAIEEGSNMVRIGRAIFRNDQCPMSQ